LRCFRHHKRYVAFQSHATSTLLQIGIHAGRCQKTVATVFTVNAMTTARSLQCIETERYGESHQGTPNSAMRHP
ncbi:hypothetical protein, partial [Microtetraspora malaysiensis]|uniref:hypothetical protein n=1 Tax=Microtetraspora malaysiensis TaxID=161358 RepID=UPI001C3F27A2